MVYIGLHSNQPAASDATYDPCAANPRPIIATADFGVKARTVRTHPSLEGRACPACPEPVEGRHTARDFLFSSVACVIARNGEPVEP